MESLPTDKIEDAEIISAVPAESITRIEDVDPLVADPSLYASVEEIEVLGGLLYIAVKHGSEIKIELSSNSVSVTVYGNIKMDEAIVTELNFERTYGAAKEFFDKLGDHEFIDVELEERDIVPQLPVKRALPGFRKQKIVSTVKCVEVVARTLKNKKDKNRARNKTAAKSRAKNR